MFFFYAGLTVPSELSTPLIRRGIGIFLILFESILPILWLQTKLVPKYFLKTLQFGLKVWQSVNFAFRMTFLEGGGCQEKPITRTVHRKVS